jgi:hypothetical protein
MYIFELTVNKMQKMLPVSVIDFTSDFKSLI